jgi:hypothetical protein
VVVGEVTSLSEEERGSFEIRGQLMPARRMAGSLRVVRVLKGKAGANVSFSFFLPDQPVGFASIADGQYGVFFFRTAPEGVVLASPYYPFVVAARQGCEASGDGLAGVVAELGCVLGSPVTKTRERAEAIDALRSVKTAEATSVLERAARGLPSPLNLLAAAVLLERNDISVLPLVEEAIQQTSFFMVEGEGFSAELHMGAALREIKDPAAIPALTRLLEATDVETRRGAARALGNTGAESAIEPLSKALYDSDWEVRWVAVIGLAKISGPDEDGNSWYPAYDEFKRNEQRYLDHRRVWAKSRR